VPAINKQLFRHDSIKIIQWWEMKRKRCLERRHSTIIAQSKHSGRSHHLAGRSFCLSHLTVALSGRGNWRNYTITLTIDCCFVRKRRDPYFVTSWGNIRHLILGSLFYVAWILEVLAFPYSAIDLASDVRSCFIRRRKLFKKLMELDHFKFNVLTEIQSGIVVVLLL